MLESIPVQYFSLGILIADVFGILIAIAALVVAILALKLNMKNKNPNTLEKKIGVTIAEFGNNLAMTEKEFIENASEVAAVVSQAGISEADMTRFLEALSSSLGS